MLFVSGGRSFLFSFCSPQFLLFLFLGSKVISVVDPT